MNVMRREKVLIYIIVCAALVLTVGCSASPSRYPPEWDAHEYEVTEVEDLSFALRDRFRVKILAPTALTPEDRIATAMDAARYFSTTTRSDFINVLIVWSPFRRSHYGNTLASVDYAPDGCGVSGSGDDCTGSIWTNLKASDTQPTKEQVEIWEAWDLHRGDFIEQIRVGKLWDEQLNEDQLKEFLAERFRTTPDHISNQMMAQSTLFRSLKKIELPD